MNALERGSTTHVQDEMKRKGTGSEKKGGGRGRLNSSRHLEQKEKKNQGGYPGKTQTQGQVRV